MDDYTISKEERALYIPSVFMKRWKAERRNDRLTWFLGAVLLILTLFIFSGGLHEAWSHIPPKVSMWGFVVYVLTGCGLAFKK